MPIELDKGHDEPIFGPGGKLNMAERLERARTIVRRYGRRARRLATSNRVRTAAGRAVRRDRRGRPV